MLQDQAQPPNTRDIEALQRELIEAQSALDALWVSELDGGRAALQAEQALAQAQAAVERARQAQPLAQARVEAALAALKQVEQQQAAMRPEEGCE